MHKIKSKYKRFISIVCILLLVFTMCFTSFADTDDTGEYMGGGRNSEGVGVEIDHTDGTKVAGSDQYGSAHSKGGYGGDISVDYVFYGSISYRNQAVYFNNSSIYKFTKKINKYEEYDNNFFPKREIKKAGYLYETENSAEATQKQLAKDTRIGDATSWGNGDVHLGPDGLYASIIMTISLTDSGSTIGDYTCGSSLKLGYEMVNGAMKATPDLQAILDHPNDPLMSKSGEKMMGIYSLKNSANKVSYVNFGEFAGIGGNGPGTPDDGDEGDTPGDDGKGDTPGDDGKGDDGKGGEGDKPDVPDPEDNFNGYVVYSPSSNGWTNDEYYVYADLKVPSHKTLASSIASLTLNNCTCDAYDKKICSHNYTTEAPCPTGDAGLDHYCTGHTSITYGPDKRTVTSTTKFHWETVYDPIKRVELPKKVYDTEEELVPHEYVTYCDVRKADTLSNPRIQWGSTYYETCHCCGRNTLYSNRGNHSCPNKGSAPYDWGRNVHTVTTMTCDGSVLNEKVTGEKARFSIAKDGSYEAYVKFSFYSIDIWNGTYNSSTLPRPVDQTHQSWTVPASGSKTAEKKSGSYKFDGTNPVVTVSTSGYTGAGTKTFVTDGYEEISWTRDTISFNIKATDALSGIDATKSYIEVSSPSGMYLKDTNTFDTYYARYELAQDGNISFAFPSSGIYNVTIYAEDNAKHGSDGVEYYRTGRTSDDGIANSITVTYGVKVDKIAPEIKIAYPKNIVAHNSKQDRFEAASSKEPYFWLFASDDDGWNGISSGLKTAKYLLTNVLEDGEAAASEGANFTGGQWNKIKVTDPLLERGKNVYLLVFAEDNVGNVAYTVTSVIKKTDMSDGNGGNPSEPCYVGPKYGTDATNANRRTVATANYFIDRSNIYYPPKGTHGGDTPGTPGTPGSPTPGTPGGRIKSAPLEITRVYDTKWDQGVKSQVISFNNRADSTNFAVYRNKLNDMIGLGYRVNFAYHVIGYGVDEGDSTTIWFALYGKQGQQYKKLDMYLLGNDNKTYTKVADDSNYFKRYFERTTTNISKDNMDANKENEMALNAYKWYAEVDDSGNIIPDEFVCYFNFSVPATAKFKFPGDSKYYTGSEVLVKVNVISNKYSEMDPSHNKVNYELASDRVAQWPGVGDNTQRFFGSSKIVPLDGDSNKYIGEAFWYDVDNTALEDLEGQKSH